MNYIKEAIYDIDLDDSFAFNYEHRRDIVLDNNELVVEGKIMALIYSEPESIKKGGMLGKIFK